MTSRLLAGVAVALVMVAVAGSTGITPSRLIVDRVPGHAVVDPATAVAGEVGGSIGLLPWITGW